MAFRFSVNVDLAVYPNDLGATWYLLKEFLKTHGWTVSMSGDGSTAFSATGDVITAGIDAFDNVATANGWSNMAAWFVLRSPAGGYEILFQRQANTSSWGALMRGIWISRVGYSSAGISASVAPAAPVDEQDLLGGSTRTNQSGNSGFSATTHVTGNPNHLHMVCDDAPAGAGEYSFAFWVSDKATQALRGESMFVDAIDDGGVAGDLAPYVFEMKPYVIGGATQTRTMFFDMHVTNKRSWGGTTGEIVMTAIRTQDRFTGGGQIDNRERAVHAYWYDNAAGIWKGRSRLFRMNSGIRNYPNTVNLATAFARIYVDHVLMPWQQDAVPL